MKKKLKALIVDDERLARRDLILLLKPFSQIEVVGEADSVPAALKAIKNLQPNLLFLDIPFQELANLLILDIPFQEI